MKTEPVTPPDPRASRRSGQASLALDAREVSMLSESDIEKRFPVWEALSELFLDTELDEITHKYIGKVILESAYTPEEIHSILWREVFPAVGDNLRCVAGEWAGFNPEWLKERILSVKMQDSYSLSGGGIISVGALIDITEQEWAKVCSYLPSEFSMPAFEKSRDFYANKTVKPKKWWQFW